MGTGGELVRVLAKGKFGGYMQVEMPAVKGFDVFVGVPDYSVHYQYRQGTILHEVRETNLRELFGKYGDLLWMNGSHKYNVTNFIGELHDLLDFPSFSTFSQEMLDQLIGKLRKRGNSNATINRKMAALSKLLRKAYKMGDVHSLPEFKRQKEKAGRIRFLDREEEDLLFSEIRAHSELYYRFCLFLVDTGARLSEGLNLRWGDMHKDRVTFWVTKSGRSRSVPLTQRAAAAAEGIAGDAGCGAPCSAACRQLVDGLHAFTHPQHTGCAGRLRQHQKSTEPGRGRGGWHSPFRAHHGRWGCQRQAALRAGC